jgi:hypothetical protein
MKREEGKGCHLGVHIHIFWCQPATLGKYLPCRLLGHAKARKVNETAATPRTAESKLKTEKAAGNRRNIKTKKLTKKMSKCNADASDQPSEDQPPTNGKQDRCLPLVKGRGRVSNHGLTHDFNCFGLNRG